MKSESFLWFLLPIALFGIIVLGTNAEKAKISTPKDYQLAQASFEAGVISHIMLVREKPAFSLHHTDTQIKESIDFWKEMSANSDGDNIFPQDYIYKEQFSEMEAPLQGFPPSMPPKTTLYSGDGYCRIKYYGKAEVEVPLVNFTVQEIKNNKDGSTEITFKYVGK